MISPNPYCPECGGPSVNHLFTKTSETFDLLTRVLATPIKPLARYIDSQGYRLIDAFSYQCANFLEKIHVLRLINEPSNEKDTDRSKCLWSSARARGVILKEVWMLGRPTSLFVAKTSDGRTMAFEGLPRPSHDPEVLEWIDDKGIMKQKFRAAGFPVPRGASCFTFSKARTVFEEIRRAGNFIVVKPTVGSRSRHTRIHIGTLEELHIAFRIAKQLGPLVSVEEELVGSVYRIVLIGNKIGGILRRDPPLITGDGKQTIENLITKANTDPRRHGHIFHEIPLNEELDAALTHQHLTRSSIPEEGKRVVVGTKVGRSQGGTNADVTDTIHEENRRLFLHIATFLKHTVVGIDFIIKDITKPWQEQMPCGVIELNSIPFLDLHSYPFDGTPRDLSLLLWDEVLKK